MPDICLPTIVDELVSDLKYIHDVFQYAVQDLIKRTARANFQCAGGGILLLITLSATRPIV